MCSVCRKRFACFIRFRSIASWQLYGNVTKLGYSLWWRQASKMKRGDLQLVTAAILIWNFTYIQKKRRVAPRSLTSKTGYSWCTLVVVNQLVLAWSAIYLISNDRSRVFSYSYSYRPVSFIISEVQLVVGWMGVLRLSWWREKSLWCFRYHHRSPEICRHVIVRQRSVLPTPA